VFVFSGQGAQWAGMGRELHEAEPIFAATIDEIDALVRTAAGWSVADAILASAEASRLDETEIAQASLFAMEVALARLWRHFGVTPAAVIGHSVGEIAAAHVAGALELAEAVQLVCARGRLMQRPSAHGRMVSFAAPLSTIAPRLRDLTERVGVAAINDGRSVVLSGDTAALAELTAQLAGDGIAGRPLRVRYAFHSPLVAPLAAELAAALATLPARTPTLTMYSTVDGGTVAAPLDAAYWARNLRQPVRFADAVDAALDDGRHQFLEVGPHPVLLASVDERLAGRAQRGLTLPSLRR
jgi:acyl transferase domain-containing protein